MKSNGNRDTEKGSGIPENAWNADFLSAAREDGSTGQPPWSGGGGGPGGGGGSGNGGGGGRPDGAGSKKGELFGDQLVILRDLDPTDGGGDGEPVLDPYNTEGQLIPVGYDPDGLVRPGDADGLFPIYFEEIEEGDYEIPAALQPFVQEVELERANVARAPDRVMEKALLAALDKIETAEMIDTDPAGRIMYLNSGTWGTIDSPLENLALYQYLMTPPEGVGRGWTVDLTDHWPADLAALLGGDVANPAWDPSALLGAAWSKEGKITLDAMLYQNTTLGVNEVTGSGATLQIDYFDFSTKDGVDSEELYDYTRSERYDDTWLLWYEDTDGDPTNLEAQYATVYDAVFGDKTAGSGVEWGAAEDLYLKVDDMGNDDPADDDFIWADAGQAGVNDFAQAADDSRAVIEFMHNYGAVEVDASVVPPESMDIML